MDNFWEGEEVKKSNNMALLKREKTKTINNNNYFILFDNKIIYMFYSKSKKEAIKIFNNYVEY